MKRLNKVTTMMKEDTRYQKAIQKNLNSIAHALWEWKELEVYDKYREEKRIYVRGASFLEITTKALFCDMLRNIINVLDKHSNVASFWYIQKVEKIDPLKAYSKQKTDSLGDLSEKLKHIRNKDFFHHDINGILDTKKVWQEANIVGRDVGEGIKYLFSILKELYEKVIKKQYNFYPDDSIGEDFVKLLDLAARNHLIEVYPKGNVTG